MLNVIIVGSFLGYIHCADNVPSGQDIQELIVHFRTLQHDVSQLKKRLECAEDKNRVLEKEILDWRHQLEMVTVENPEPRKKISTLGTSGLKTRFYSNDVVSLNKRLLPATTHRVAFSVSLTHHVTLGYLQTINYDKIITNLGNAYDPTEGHFVAPLKGLYLLSASMMNYIHDMQPLEMVKNGIQLAVMYCSPVDNNTSSQTVVVVLEQGDKVWIRRFRDHSSATLYGFPNEPYNTFSGVLLYEM